jgi:hypothetical protein
MYLQGYQMVAVTQFPRQGALEEKQDNLVIPKQQQQQAPKILEPAVL